MADMRQAEPMERLEHDGAAETGSKVKVGSNSPTFDTGQVGGEDTGLDREDLTLGQCRVDGISVNDGENSNLLEQGVSFDVERLDVNESSHKSESVTDQKMGLQDHDIEDEVLTLSEFGKENLTHDKNNLSVQNSIGSRLETSSVTLSPSSRGKNSISQKPGVILLGRGNSFSLGRSEVILLHHRQKPSNEKRTKRNAFGGSTKDGKLVLNFDDDSNSSNNSGDKFNSLQTIEERLDNPNVARLKSTTEVDGIVSGYPPVPSPSPPPVSNGLCHLDSRQTLNGESSDSSSGVVLDLTPSYDDELKDLWTRAESVMASRNGRVCKILEEFGIGRPGGGGGEDDKGNDWDDEDVEDRKKEEEDVWRIIQDNFPD